MTSAMLQLWSKVPNAMFISIFLYWLQVNVCYNAAGTSDLPAPRVMRLMLIAHIPNL
jgi:hypothetical protein